MNLTGKPPPGPKQPKIVNGTRRGLLHMRRVKTLPCVVCGASAPSDAHHCRSDGMARDDFKTISLCKSCHQGQHGYHNAKETWEGANGKDYEFLPVVADMLAGEWNDPRGGVIFVDAVRDEEASVWVATSDDIGGLAVEAETFEALAEKVIAAITDLVEMNGLPGKPTGDDHEYTAATQDALER